MEGATYAKLYACLIRSLLVNGYEFEDETESQIISLLLDESINFFQQNDPSDYSYKKFRDQLVEKLSSSDFELILSKSDADYLMKREISSMKSEICSVTFEVVQDDLIRTLVSPRETLTYQGQTYQLLHSSNNIENNRIAFQTKYGPEVGQICNGGEYDIYRNDNRLLVCFEVTENWRPHLEADKIAKTVAWMHLSSDADEDAVKPVSLPNVYDFINDKLLFVFVDSRDGGETHLVSKAADGTFESLAYVFGP